MGNIVFDKSIPPPPTVVTVGLVSVVVMAVGPVTVGIVTVGLMTCK